MHDEKNMIDDKQLSEVNGGLGESITISNKVHPKYSCEFYRIKFDLCGINGAPGGDPHKKICANCCSFNGATSICNNKDRVRQTLELQLLSM